MNETHDRPLNVTILAIFVLFITSWNVIRSFAALVNWAILSEFGARPAYILTTGLVWVSAGLWLFFQLWRGRFLAFRAGLILSGLYFAWYWLDRLFIQPASAPNVGFSAIVSVVFLVYVSLGLMASKAFFDKE